MKKFRFFISCLFALCLVMFFQVDSHAMTRYTIPRRIEGLGAYYPGNDFGRKADLSVKTYVRHEWHGIAGTTKVSAYESPNVANTKGTMLFMVPANRDAFEYRDCLDVYFENVGNFQNRKLNCRLHVDSVKFGPYTPNGKYNVSYSSNPTGIFLLQNYNGPELFFGRSDQQEYFPGLEQRYDANKDIQITLTFTYVDDGSIVDFPFYQYVDDIDNNNLWNTYGSQEGITFGNGFTDNLYVYDGFRCSVNGRTVKVPNDGRNHNYSDFFVPPPVPGATSGEKHSDDKRVAEAGWFLNACWGATTNGRFTMTFHGANAVAAMNVRSPWLEKSIIQTPEKTGAASSNEPERVRWKIKQYIPSLNGEILDPFRSLVVTDVLDNRLLYESVKVYDESGSDITNQASVTYDAGSRRVTVSMKSSWLSDRSHYGQTVLVEISTKFASNIDSAENTCEVSIDGGIPICSKPRKVIRPKETGIGLSKFVINKQDSYGPGDIVDFLVVIDTASYAAPVPNPADYAYLYAGIYSLQELEYRDRDHPLPAGKIRNAVVWWNGVMSDFHYQDRIPDGLQLLGEPQVRFIYRWGEECHDTWDGYGDKIIRTISGCDYDRIPDGSGGSTYLYYPYTQKALYDKFLKRDSVCSHILGYETVPNAFSQNVTSKGWDQYDRNGLYCCYQPKIVAHHCDRDPVTGVFDASGMIYEFEHGYPTEGIRSFFSRGLLWSEHDPDDLTDDSLWLLHQPPLKVSLSDQEIRVDGSKQSIILDAWTVYKTFGDGYFQTNRVDGYDDGSYYVNMGMVGIHYQCRVTGTKTNVDVTNYSSVSGVPACFLNDDNERTGYKDRVKIWDKFDRVSAEAQATVHLGGYHVTTEVVNGTIDDAVYDLDAGADVGIGYERNAGYYLESIEVDGQPVSVGANPKMYQFKNIQNSHHIKVVYAKGHDITTEVVHGKIDAPYYGVKPGDSKQINYVPDEGYMLEKIEVDGRLVDTSTCLDRYLFTNVQSDHHIKVTYIPAWKVVTSIEHGTITPTITGITPGSSKTITYTPDSGYYVKSVTVDGALLTGDALKSHLGSYVFSNIREDHTIHVVCAPYPTITVTKEIENVGKIVWAKGSPVFTFTVSGTDYLGANHIYVRSISFVKSDGNKKSVTMKIPAGRWTVSELKFDGWQQVSVKAGNACTVSGLNGVLDTRDADTASVTFVNRVDDWNRYTGNDDRVNQLR